MVVSLSSSSMCRCGMSEEFTGSRRRNCSRSIALVVVMLGTKPRSATSRRGSDPILACSQGRIARPIANDRIAGDPNVNRTWVASDRIAGDRRLLRRAVRSHALRRQRRARRCSGRGRGDAKRRQWGGRGAIHRISPASGFSMIARRPCGPCSPPHTPPANLRARVHLSAP